MTFIWRYRELVAIAILFVLVFVFYKMYQTEKTARQQAEKGLKASINIANMLTSENDYYRNKKGDTVVRVKSIVAPSAKSVFNQPNMDGFRALEAIKNDGSNIVNASTFTSEFILLDEDGKEIILKDSTKLKWFKYADSYNDINVLMADSSKLSIKNRYWQATTIVRKKRWFIKFQWSKKKKFDVVSEIVDSNVRAKIDSLQTVTIK
jgi:hypothetical protein